jgi:hypothetical protein
MATSHFWRIVAVLLVVGVFYVGHGLHERTGFSLPSFVNQARANGVASLPGKFSNDADFGDIAVTCSPDGKTVYYFGPRELLADRKLQRYKIGDYIGSASVPDANK